MTTSSISFPQYRKYKNNKSFFKIHSFAQWDEIQVIGTKYIFHTYEVKILPDRNFINDMLMDYQANWEVISAEEYDAVKILCSKVVD